jgi:hypothetical protein
MQGEVLRVHLGRVVLRNIKGFPAADLDFRSDDGTLPGMAVITGDNGAGKTALLRAISLALLGPEQTLGLVQDFSGWVTSGADLGTISVEVVPDHEVDKTSRGGAPTTSFWAEVKIDKEFGVWSMDSTDVFRNKKKGATNGPWAVATPGWLTLAYGPFRRMYGSSPDASRLMVMPGRIPHFATLFKEEATLGEGEQWLKLLNYRKLEQRKDEAEAILSTLLDLVRDDFMREGVQLEMVDSEGIWLLDAERRRISLAEMSEGYRSALAMLIDVYRHMVEAYGIKDLVEDREGKMCVTKPGVVLIDELDAHLHPAWQQKIGAWLKEHFPQVQFIVTTHSPIVCQSADGGRIYHVPSSGLAEEPFRIRADQYRTIVAGKPDEILLTPAFGLRNTRSPKATNARKRHAQLYSKQLSFDLTASEVQELDDLRFFIPDKPDSMQASNEG